jgi:hypothetical protein
MPRLFNSKNIANIKGNLRKIGCNSRNKLKVAQMCHFCETGKLSTQPLKRLTNSSPVIISHTLSKESVLD